jgi:FO synthase
MRYWLNMLLSRSHPPDDVWAVVPIKDTAQAKARMIGLGEDKRAALAMAMAQHTLATLRSVTALAGIIVITSDGAIETLAADAGTHVIADQGAGLNPAFEEGISRARLEGATHILLMHADFVALEREQIQAMITRHVDGLGLLRCKEGTGTNAVLMRADAAFTPCFGANSFARHWTAAGEQAYALDAPSLAYDIDTMADLIAVRAAGAIPSPALEALLSTSVLSGEMVTYSPKVFLPLTELCRDTCHYCTFAKTPKRVTAPYMSVERAVAVAAAGAKIGCKEALFTLGDRPEDRYTAAADWLAENGFASTLHYVAHVAKTVRDETGLLPHINAGCMSAEEMAMLRPVSASMGLMLESAAERLCESGGPHYGSPDKHPVVRLATIAEAGRQNIPFTTGILIGIGETRAERVEALEAIRALHLRYGHIQELIIQNFLPKRGTKMVHVLPAPLEELCWTVATAREMFGPNMSIQAPPNLNAGNLGALIASGINDWGGVSPLTPDYVNPEAPWPEIERLRAETAAAGKQLIARLTIYPPYIKDSERWIAPEMRRFVSEHADGARLAREEDWRTGRSGTVPPAYLTYAPSSQPTAIQALVKDVLDYGGDHLGTPEIAQLFSARGGDFHTVCQAADHARAAANGNVASYVINRNINYTNICTFKCAFCAFSKGTRTHEGAERPYLLDLAEVARRVVEAQDRGATEVCLQGGIHPQFTGETYLSIVRAVKAAVPEMHVHAFSPLEISHGAFTLGMALDDYLILLRDAGLGSLPGTAAEILHDPIRTQICPDKLNSAQWIEVIETAHRVGLPTTSTIMFGHVDSYEDWAIHLETLRALQMRSLKNGAVGITEFVPLPFVAHEAPMYKRGQARPGPTFREAILMHAVARLVLAPWISNIQASWVKLGREGMRFALQSGANDLGGVLMDESITRAAGAEHGQEMNAAAMHNMAASLGRLPQQRLTLYQSLGSDPVHEQPQVPA